MTQPVTPYQGLVQNAPQAGFRSYATTGSGNGLGQVGGTVGNFGSVARQNAMTPGGAVGNAAQPGGDSWGAKGPGISDMQQYGDYQQLGTTAQQYGAAAGQALNNPTVNSGMAALQGQMGMSPQQQAAYNDTNFGIQRLNYAAAGQGPGMGQLAASSNGQGAGMSSLQANAMGGGPGAVGLLAASAIGQGPNPAAIAAAQGQQAAQNYAAAQAASARGNFGAAGAQKQAMQTGAALSQQNTQTAALAAAQQQLGSQAQYAQAQGQAQGTLAGAVGQAQGQYSGALGQAQGNLAQAANQQYTGASAESGAANRGGECALWGWGRTAGRQRELRPWAADRLPAAGARGGLARGGAGQPGSRAGRAKRPAEHREQSADAGLRRDGRRRGRWPRGRARMNNYDPTADPALQSLASGGLSPQLTQQLNASYMPPQVSQGGPPLPPEPPPAWAQPGALGGPTGPAPAAPPAIVPQQTQALNLAPSSLPPVGPAAPPTLPTPQQHAQLQHLADAQQGHSYTSSGGAAAPATTAAPQPAMSPGSPGGMQMTSESVEKGIQDPELAKAQERAQAADREAVDAAQNFQHVQAVKAQRSAIQDQINAAKEKLVAGHVDSEMNAARGQMDQARAESAEAQAKGVDPNHWTASKGAGSRIAMVISMIAGGMVAGLKGGPNQAAEMIEHEKDQDLQAQRENIETKGQKAKSATEAYQLVKDKGLDDTQKAHAASVLASDALMKQIDAKMSEDGTTPEGRVQLAQVKQQIAEKAQQSLLSFDEHTKDKIHQTLSYRPAVAPGGSGPRELEARAHKAKFLSLGYNEADSTRLGRMAAKLPDIAPGSAVTVPVKGGGSVGRMAKPKVQLETALGELDEIHKLSVKPILYPRRARQTADADGARQGERHRRSSRARRARSTSLAEQLTGTRAAQVGTAKQEAQRKLANIDALSKSGALAGGEADAAEAP